MAASAVDETVACFHAKDAIANLNEPASEALASSGRVRPVPAKCPESRDFGVHLVSVFGPAAS